MSSPPPTLPPAALANQQAKAMTDRIAVRVISAPNGMQNNDAPTRVQGTVIGQDKSSGAITIETDRGLVQLGLRDRGSLPVGTRIDIEIPAGRNSQQATIAIDKTPAATPTSNTSTPTLANALNTLEIKQNLTPEAAGSVLNSPARQAASNPLQVIAEAPLEPDQLIRLTPSTIPATLLGAAQNAETLPQEVQAQLANTLLNMLQSLPAGANSPLRQNILILLGQLAANGTPAGTAGTTPQKPPTTPEFINNINKILQLLENKSIFQNLQSLPPSQPPNVPQLQTPALLNFAKPLDGQIIGFVTPQLTTPASTATTPAPQLATFTTTPLPAAGKPVFIGQYLGQVASPQVGQPPQAMIAMTIPQTPLQNTTNPNGTHFFALSTTPTNLPVGSQVLMTLEPAKGASPLPPITTETPVPLKALLQNWMIGTGTPAMPDLSWDSLNDMVTLLNHTTPAQANALMQMIPSPNMSPQHVGPLGLMFLSMMRSGDIESWVGSQSMSILRQSTRGIEILRSLTSESGMLKLTETGIALPQDWKMMVLPFAFQQNIEKTPVYYKHMPDEGEKEDAERKARRRLRFLFDLRLNRMGGVQVDGFMQPDSKTQRLDIILRTKTALSVPMQEQMRKVYAGAMDKSHLVGDLSFQFRPEQWVTLDLGAAAAHNDTILA